MIDQTLAAPIALAIAVALFLLGALLVIRTGRRVRRDVQVRRLTAIMETGVNPASAAVDEDGPSLPRFLVVRMARAGLEPRALPVLLVLFTVLLAGLAVGLAVSPVAGFGAAFVLLVLALLVLERLASRRLRRFADALPGFVDRIRQLVGIGNNLQQAVTRAAQNAPAEVQPFLRPLLWRMGHGIPVHDALSWFARRINLQETNLLAAAVATNMRFGGQISGILEHLVETLHNRQRVARELRAATGEARATGWILGLLTPIVCGVVFVLNPSYLDFFLTDPDGTRPMILALGLQVTGILLIIRALRLDY